MITSDALRLITITGPPSVQETLWLLSRRWPLIPWWRLAVRYQCLHFTRSVSSSKHDIDRQWFCMEIRGGLDVNVISWRTQAISDSSRTFSSQPNSLYLSNVDVSCTRHLISEARNTRWYYKTASIIFVVCDIGLYRKL